MITGFNTDIKFGGVTYHVQTEDKGLSKPIILSLVYDRGTILASKRQPYDDLLNNGFDEKVLTERLQKQHRLICAAVQTGRINELKEMTVRESAKVKAGRGMAIEAGANGNGSIRNASIAPSIFEPFERDVPIPKPAANGFGQMPASFYVNGPLVEAVAVIEESLILPAEAVEILGDPPLPVRPASNALSIELLGETVLKGGDRRIVGFLVCRGSGRRVVTGAQIMVKVLGSSFRPLIFHARTDSNGVARVNVHLPNFNSGRALFLVRAISDGEEIELRRPIAHG